MNPGRNVHALFSVGSLRNDNLITMSRHRTTVRPVFSTFMAYNSIFFTVNGMNSKHFVTNFPQNVPVKF